MSLAIRYKLVGFGWAECEIEFDGQTTLITASYLEDALGNLAEAALGIANGEKQVYAIFAEEPGEYRWKLSRVNETELEVEILSFDDWNDFRKSDEQGAEILKFQCAPATFLRRIVICLSDVLNEYGFDGYKKSWGMHEFPLQQYQKLRQALKSLK